MASPDRSASVRPRLTRSSCQLFAQSNATLCVLAMWWRVLALCRVVAMGGVCCLGWCVLAMWWRCCLVLACVDRVVVDVLTRSTLRICRWSFLPCRVLRALYRGFSEQPRVATIFYWRRDIASSVSFFGSFPNFFNASLPLPCVCHNVMATCEAH